MKLKMILVIVLCLVLASSNAMAVTIFKSAGPSAAPVFVDSSI